MQIKKSHKYFVQKKNKKFEFDHILLALSIASFISILNPYRFHIKHICIYVCIISTFHQIIKQTNYRNYRVCNAASKRGRTVNLT